MQYGVVVGYDPVKGVGIIKYPQGDGFTQIFVNRASLNVRPVEGKAPRLYKGQQVVFTLGETAFGRSIARDVRPKMFRWQGFRPKKRPSD